MVTDDQELKARKYLDRLTLPCMSSVGLHRCWKVFRRSVMISSAAQGKQPQCQRLSFLVLAAFSISTGPFRPLVLFITFLCTWQILTFAS